MRLSHIKLITSTTTSNPYLQRLLLLLIGLCCIGLGINFYHYHYPGNNYFPPDSLFLGMLLVLMLVGSHLSTSSQSYLTYLIREILFFFLIMSLIALATNAVQFTPFSTVDEKILLFESVLHMNTPATLSWTHAHPTFKKILAYAYGSLTYQMCYLPIFIILMKKTLLIREYYFLLLLTTVMGFLVYYFFPTTGPASWLSSDYFSDIQRATGLKFKEIHHYISPSTINGGLIAFPSFHTIWAWLCVYLFRGYKLILFVLVPLNILLVCACVMLGWHYLVDIIGSGLIVFIAHYVYRAVEKPHAPVILA